MNAWHRSWLWSVARTVDSSYLRTHPFTCLSLHGEILKSLTVVKVISHKGESNHTRGGNAVVNL